MYILLPDSFVLSRIESIFGMELRCDNRHQPHTSLLWKLDLPWHVLSRIEFIFCMKFP